VAAAHFAATLVQAQMRHSRIGTTMDIYAPSVPNHNGVRSRRWWTW